MRTTERLNEHLRAMCARCELFTASWRRIGWARMVTRHHSHLSHRSLCINAGNSAQHTHTHTADRITRTHSTQTHTMASINELKEALLQTLAAKGSLGQMKARLRSEIFNALDHSNENDNPNKPPLSNTNMMINELIREYLLFNQYRYSLNVFVPETNQPEVPPFDRNFMAKELHVQENQHSVQIPLLYSIVALLQQNKVGEVTSGVSMEPTPLQQAAFGAPSSSSVSSSSRPFPSSTPPPASTAAAVQTSQVQLQAHQRTNSNQQTQFANIPSIGDSLADTPKPLYYAQRS